MASLQGEVERGRQGWKQGDRLGSRYDKPGDGVVVVKVLRSSGTLQKSQ